MIQYTMLWGGKMSKMSEIRRKMGRGNYLPKQGRIDSSCYCYHFRIYFHSSCYYPQPWELCRCSLVPIRYGGRPNGPSECENTLQNDHHNTRPTTLYNVWCIWLVSFPSVMVVGPTDHRSVKTHCRTTTITSGAFGRENHPSSHSVTNRNNYA